MVHVISMHGPPSLAYSNFLHSIIDENVEREKESSVKTLGTLDKNLGYSWISW